MKWHGTILAALALILLAGTAAFAHCEIPCGIYGDQMRLDQIAEHIQTVEKSMKEIEALDTDTALKRNQLTRWIVNKDEHAVKIQDIVWQYFMAQRIKPTDAKEGAEHEKYVREITLLHQMIVEAMKCKQTLGHQHVENLRSLLDRFGKSYMGEGKQEHMKEHHGSGTK